MSYILLLYSVAFLLFLFVNVLLHIYASYTWPIEKGVTLSNGAAKGSTSGQNGRIPANGPAVSPMARAVRDHVRDAAEFELEALMSEDESGGEAGRKKEAV